MSKGFKDLLHGARKTVVQAQLRICELRLDDIPQAVKIVKQNYNAEDAKLAMWEMMEALNGAKPQPVYFAAWIDDMLVGFLGICDSFMDTRVYEIFWVNVLPDYQKCGVGKRLIRRALELAKQRDAALVMFTAKESVLKFYQKLGFQVVGGDRPERVAGTDFIVRAEPKAALNFI